MSSIDQGGGKRCTTSNKGPDQNSKAVGSVLVPNGFALDPDAVIREGTGAVELAVGGAHPCIPLMRRKGSKAPVRSEITKASKGSFVAARNCRCGCPGSVSAPSDLPELGLSAGSTVRILSR
jgi:hypothetical protein